MKYTDLKTFEDACKVLELDAETVIPNFSCLPEEKQKAMIAHVKLIFIAEAANKIENGGEVWIPDWNNQDEFKYYPWFKKSLSGLRCDDFDYWIARTTVGSRLCYKTKELAEYIGNQFSDLYEDDFIIEKAVENSFLNYKGIEWSLETLKKMIDKS